MKVSARCVLVILVLAALYLAGIIYRAEVDAVRSVLAVYTDNFLIAKVDGRDICSWDKGESWYCYKDGMLVAKVGQDSDKCPEMANLDVLAAELIERNEALWEKSFWLPTLYRARDQLGSSYASFTGAYGEDYECFGVSIDHRQTYTAIDETTGEVLGSFYEVCPQAKIFLLYELYVDYGLDVKDPADRKVLEELGFDLEELGIEPLPEDR